VSESVFFNTPVTAVAHIEDEGNSIVLETGITLLEISDVGIPGPPGQDPTPSVVASVDMAAGTPVTISRVNGQLDPSRSDNKPLSFVKGIITEDILAGFTVVPKRGAVSLSDWTAICGTSSLLVGQTYFLQPTGGLGTSVPGSPNCIVFIGVAMDATTLLVNPGSPIQL
jgi:hypothetical protein